MHKAIIDSRKTHVKPEGFKLNKDDVWGAYDVDTHKKVGDGLVIAQETNGRCPVFGDNAPYKSVTVVFDPKTHPYDEVLYWLGYVHGGEHERELTLKDGRIAIRSDYQCW